MSVSNIIEKKASIQVHPLVILSISEYYVRQKMLNGSSTRVYGALTGTQNGLVTEIFNCFELVIKEDKDDEFFKKKCSQFKKVFENSEVLGWYATGELKDSDIAIHEQMMKYNENPVFLTLNTEALDVKDLPLSLYETEMHVFDTQPVLKFIKIGYNISTDEAERISIEHITDSINKTQTTSVTSHLHSTCFAVEILSSRIKLLRDYVQLMKEGSVTIDHGILRSISGVIQSIPIFPTNKYKHESILEHNDALLLTYLQASTTGILKMRDIVDKYKRKSPQYSLEFSMFTDPNESYHRDNMSNKKGPSSREKPSAFFSNNICPNLTSNSASDMDIDIE